MSPPKRRVIVFFECGASEEGFITFSEAGGSTSAGVFTVFGLVAQDENAKKKRMLKL